MKIGIRNEKMLGFINYHLNMQFVDIVTFILFGIDSVFHCGIKTALIIFSNSIQC